MIIRNTILFLYLVSVTSISSAGVFGEGGVHFGGDELATVSFYGADSESVEAGGLISAALGYEFDITDTFLVKLSAGIKIDMVTASNGDVDFTRYPLTGMVFLKGEDIHVGAGITQHTGVDLNVDGFLSSGSIDFDDATGLVFQVDYMLNERGYLSLTYTAIDYEPANSSGIEVNGNSLGFGIGFKFGK